MSIEWRRTPLAGVYMCVLNIPRAIPPRSKSSTLHPQTGTMRDPESNFEVTRAEGAALFWRNMVLIVLSLLAGGRTLYLIGLAQFGRAASGVTWSGGGGGTVGGHHHPHTPSVRSFANFLMFVLLLAEVVASLSWLLGVAVAGGADGSAPWTIDLETAERLCAPVRGLGWGMEALGGLLGDLSCHLRVPSVYRFSRLRSRAGGARELLRQPLHLHVARR